MKITKIELENIFAYSGQIVLDLSTTTPERNLVLVWGRNGMGKTSLLNSVKLLFLGAEDRKLRTVGFPARVLGHRQFVIGDGAGWSGVINTRARHREPDAQARVRLSWESDGIQVTAERQWRITNAGYRETLIVDDGEARLTGEAAERRLADFLPRDFVDFFFFDGEEIKALAEMSEGRKAVDFDRVLRISFITELASELSQLATERQRALLAEDVRVRIANAEGEIKRAEAIQQSASEQSDLLEEQLADKRGERRQLQARRDNLRSGASSAERELLEQQKTELTILLDQQIIDLSDAVPPPAPMLANPGLVKAALRELDERLNAAGSSEQLLIRRIQSNLLAWLREGPPTLHQRTADAVASSLNNRLDNFVKPSKATGLFAKTDASRAYQIRDILVRYSGPEPRRAHAQLLAAARRTRVELQRTKDALMQLEVGSEATIEEFREITSKIEGIDDEISSLDQALGQQQKRLADAKAMEERERETLRELERTSANAQQQSQDAVYIGRVARSLNDLREELRRSMRDRVQALINEKFKILVHDHNLVQEVELDDTYTLIFKDERGERIGRSSLSSGLKQLAATALLWAMKEVPGHDIPVLIDTPLGRIDRENQENMLLNYYPQLAGQVLILPTNAEIDQRKYQLIRDRVAKEYTIQNDTGDGASVRSGSLLQ